MFLSPGPAGSSGRLLLLKIGCGALLLLVPITLASAQGGNDLMGTGGKHRIQGRIYFPSGRRADANAVRVTLESSSSERLSLVADLNGSFSFNSIAPGSYYLTVDPGKDYEIAHSRLLILRVLISHAFSTLLSISN